MNFPALLVNICDRLTDKRVNKPVPTEGVTVQKDIVYNPQRFKHCKLDIYRKEGLSGKLPVIVNVHGGSFVATDKHYRRGFAYQYAAAGYVVLNLDYQLAPKNKYEGLIKDVYSALTFVKENADALNFDISKVIVCGDSAGGYLASAMCALATNDVLRKAYGVQDAGVVPMGAVLYCGVYNPVKLLDEKMILNQQKMIGKLVFGITTKQEFCSIPDYRKADITAFVTSAFPPTFISHTDADDMCPAQGPLFVEALKRAGVTFQEFHAVKIPVSHDWQLSAQNPFSFKVHEATQEFLADLQNGKATDRYFEI